MSLKIKLRNVSLCEHECADCRESFKTALHLKYHRSRMHNPRRPFVCKECRKSFRRIHELQEHCRQHQSTARYECEVCNTLWSCKRLLDRHMSQHLHYEGDHTCSYCSASFITLSEARLHVLIVHENPIVLPAERVRRAQPEVQYCRGNASQFCVRGGEGLKLRLKRKLSTDGADDHGLTTCDLNPASQATIDSGKGNSDMDEEESHRNSNSLLRSPVFMPKQEDMTSSDNSGSLLVKPKFEVNQAHRFGSSQLQPGLNSLDFLSKTKFVNSKIGLNPSSFMLAPALNGTTPFKSRPFRTLTSSNMTTALNGSNLFRSPASFLNNSKPAFGAAALSLKSGFPGFGQTTEGFGFLPPAFGSSHSSSVFGSAARKPGPKTFGSLDLSATSTPTAQNPVDSLSSQQNVVGAAVDKSQGFERYAARGCAEESSNPFAAAMLQAKAKKQMRTDSIDLSESESYYSDSGDEESGETEPEEDSGVNEELSHTSEERPEVAQSIQIDTRLLPLAEPPSVPAPSPYRTPKTTAPRTPQRFSPRKTPSRLSQTTSQNFIDTQPGYTSATELNKQPVGPLTNGRLSFGELSPSVSMTPTWDGMGNGIIDSKLAESLEGTQQRRSSRTRNSTPRRQPSIGKSPPNYQMEMNCNELDGGMGQIRYHIDMDTPILSLSIPKELLRKGRMTNREGVKRGKIRSTVHSSPQRDVFVSPKPPQSSAKLRVPTKPAVMKSRMVQQKQKRIKKVKIGPKSYMKRVNGALCYNDEDTGLVELFYPVEMEARLSCARTDYSAARKAGFKENQKFLSYLRKRALDLIITLFPAIRIGGNFCKDSDDVEGLLDHLIDLLQDKCSSTRCVPSLSSRRDRLEVNLGSTSRLSVRFMQRRLCKLIRLLYPTLTVESLTNDGITTLPKLIHKVITENSGG